MTTRSFLSNLYIEGDMAEVGEMTRDVKALNHHNENVTHKQSFKNWSRR